MRRISLKSGFSSILFWSIISAAFIGPGTVTTASQAGANYGLTLLWALLFAIIATILLQEGSARITIASGFSLGEAIAKKYRRKSRRIKIFLVFAIVFGGAAYQAGNIMGAVSGLKLIFNYSEVMITIPIVLLASILLWTGNTTFIARSLGVIVAFMGIIFILVAFNTQYTFIHLLEGAILPQIPDGSEILVIGLIGTTIVPYNLFLASGISHGQSMDRMRFGIIFAVIIGGIISMAVLIAGSLVTESFSFESLFNVLTQTSGKWAGLLMSLGLFAAGFTSAVTAPLASAITAQSILGNEDKSWKSKGINFRLIWIGTILVGFFFGISGYQPIPVIIMAQAINGFLLPFIAVFLIIILNDKDLLPKNYLNKKFNNILLILVVLITFILGMMNVYKAGIGLLNYF